MTTERYQYNGQLAHDICYGCGSKSMKNTFAYFRMMQHNSPQTFWCEFEGEDGFYVANRGRDHVRLVGIAVRSSAQGRGIGKKLFFSLLSRAKQDGLSKVTFRTSIYERAQDFYAKMGCKVVGLKDDDFEMEYSIL